MSEKEEPVKGYRPKRNRTDKNVHYSVTPKERLTADQKRYNSIINAGWKLALRETMDYVNNYREFPYPGENAKPSEVQRWANQKHSMMTSLAGHMKALQTLQKMLASDTTKTEQNVLTVMKGQTVNRKVTSVLAQLRKENEGKEHKNNDYSEDVKDEDSEEDSGSGDDE